MLLPTALAGLLAAADLTSPPLALVASGDSMEVFTTGSDSAIWTRSLRPNPYPGKWSPWVSLGGKAATPPSAVTSKDGAGGTQLHLFYFDADSNLQVRIRNNASWSEATRVEGLRSGQAPSAGWRKGELDVFATSPDRLVRRVSWNGTAWQGPAATLPDSTHVAPTALGFDAVSFYENLFVLDRTGTFREQWWNGSAWKGPVTIPGGGLASSAATAYYADRSHLLCATDSLRRLWCNNYPVTSWEGWKLVGSGIASAPSLLQSTDGSLHLLALDARRQVVRFGRSIGGSVWTLLDTTLLPLDTSTLTTPRLNQHRNPPFALHATSDTGLVVFRADPADSTIQSRTWHRGTWSPWVTVGGKAGSPPAVTPDGTTLAWRRADSSIGYRSRSAGVWGNEATVPELKSGLSPSLTLRGSTIDVIAVAPGGIFGSSLAAGSWSNPVLLGKTSPHAALALGFDADYRYQNVYVVDSSGTLLERWWAGSTWSSWSTLSAFPQPAVTAPGSVHLGGTRHVTCIGLPSNTLSCMIWNGSAWGARSDFPSVVSAGVLTLAADASAHLLAMDTAGHLVHFRYSTDWQRVPDDGTFAPLSANRTVRTREPNALLVRGNLLDLSRIPQSTPLLLVSPTGNTRPLAWRTEQRLPHGAWSHLVTGQGPEARTLRLVRVR